MKSNSRDGWLAALPATPTPPPVVVTYDAPPPDPRLGFGLPPPPPPLGFDAYPYGAMPAPPPPPLGFDAYPYGAMPAPPPFVVSPEGRRRSVPWAVRLTLGTLLLLAAAMAVVFVVGRTVTAMPPVALSAWQAMVPASRALFLADATAHKGGAAHVLAAPHVLTRLQDALPAPMLPKPSVPAPSIRHEGYASIRGGVLFALDSFAPTGSSYDLLVHFHGNTQLVRESAEVAGLNAVVAVVNLGIGSGPYEDTYGVPGNFEALLTDIDRAVAQRGVPSPRVRRIALSSWSAGYGAISKILELRRATEAVDAVLVMDGIHCGFLQERAGALNTLQLAAFARAAQLAAAGQILFTITHSEIDPIAYASSSATATYLLDTAAGHVVEQMPAFDAPEHLHLRAAEGAVSKKLEKQMIPTTEAALGSLHIRGYRGNTPEHHMAHLLQMGATVLPELVARWRTGGDEPSPTP